MRFILIFAFAVCLTQSLEVAPATNITLCQTPNWEPGYCVPLLWCPALVKALANYLYDDIWYFENSKCGDFKVCCGAWTRLDESRFFDGDEEVPDSTLGYNISDELGRSLADIRDFARNKFVVSLRRYCGLQHADDRLYNDTETALDEAPWLVNFIARHILAHRGAPKRDDYYAYCAGTLITNQHVISSSYCSHKNYWVQSVRLGQYHPRQNISCVEDPGAEEDCTGKIVDIPIEKYFRIGDSNFFIYKLARKVSFTDYIRPICLPLRDTERPGEGDLVISSGWGDGEEALIAKKRVVNKIVSEQQCDGFNDSVRFGKINKKYAMCAHKQESSNADGKYGDQGGPFAFPIKHKWYLDGVINYVRGEYLIGEKVTPQILDWILDALYHFHENPQL